jgi:quercetin dioxygenase-like cupin family protein
MGTLIINKFVFVKSSISLYDEKNARGGTHANHTWSSSMDYFNDFKTKKGISPLAGFTFKEAHLDNVMITWVEMEPGSVLPEHKHPHEQISLVVEGMLELTVGGRTKIMKKGDVAVVPPGVLHSGRVHGEFTIAVDAWNPIREDYIRKP